MHRGERREAREREHRLRAAHQDGAADRDGDDHRERPVPAARRPHCRDEQRRHEQHRDGDHGDDAVGREHLPERPDARTPGRFGGGHAVRGLLGGHASQRMAGSRQGAVASGGIIRSADDRRDGLRSRSGPAASGRPATPSPPSRAGRGAPACRARARSLPGHPPPPAAAASRPCR